jgi:hypothetical protein
LLPSPQNFTVIPYYQLSANKFENYVMWLNITAVNFLLSFVDLFQLIQSYEKGIQTGSCVAILTLFFSHEIILVCYRCLFLYWPFAPYPRHCHGSYETDKSRVVTMCVQWYTTELSQSDSRIILVLLLAIDNTGTCMWLIATRQDISVGLPQGGREPSDLYRNQKCTTMK